MMKKRVCVIGAGPSGMCLMFHVDRMKRAGLQVPEVVCYEKQADWGGLWNYDWRTGRYKWASGLFMIKILAYLSFR